MQIVITPDAALQRIQDAVQAAGDKKARAGLARAVNHTGRKALTAVRRALVLQTSIPRTVVVVGVTPRPAGVMSDGPLEFRIVGTGRPIPLKVFRARQTKAGVTARVWGGPKEYRSAFIVSSLGAHVFKRKGKPRLPIRKLHGPAIAPEMVKDQSLAAFERVAKELPARVDHELQRLLP